MRVLLAVLVAGAVTSASADNDTMDEVFVPTACEPFWTIPGGMDSPVAWSQVFSFAACIHDARLVRIDASTDLEQVIDELDAEMMPVLRLYAAALQEGPADVKLRAAYHIGMSQITLLTRLRLSVGKSRALRDKLEPLLEDTALLAWKSFAMVELVADGDPSVASDSVTRTMVTSSREMAVSLAVAFAFDRANENRGRLIAR